jgi:hypothetical protein
MAATNYQFNWPTMSPDFRAWWDKVVEYRIASMHHDHDHEHTHSHPPRFITENGNEYIIHRETMRSKYMPHQGKKEVARRLKQQELINGYLPC